MEDVKIRIDQITERSRSRGARQHEQSHEVRLGLLGVGPTHWGAQSSKIEAYAGRNRRWLVGPGRSI